MKSIHSKIILLTFVLISFIACGQKEKGKSNNTNSDQASISLISPSDLNNVNKDILLIDVRTPQEFASGHLENAVNINYFDSDFTAQLKTLDKIYPGDRLDNDLMNRKSTPSKIETSTALDKKINELQSWSTTMSFLRLAQGIWYFKKLVSCQFNIIG